MNEKLTMTLKWLSYVALFFCAVWFVFLCYQSYHQVFDTTGSQEFSMRNCSLKRTSGLSSLLLFYFSFKQLHQTILIRHSFLKALQQ